MQRASWLAVLALPLATACATARDGAAAPQFKVAPVADPPKKDAPAPAPDKPVLPPQEGDKKYTDHEFGFEVERPDGWGFAPRVEAPDGGSIPLVIAQPDKGAQVIVQVAPRVASPEEISGDLRDKLDEHPGIEAGKNAPLANGGEPGFGFGFTAEGERAGRVAVVEGGDKLFVVIGSWPKGADDKLKNEVDGIFGSLHKTAAAKKKGGM